MSRKNILLSFFVIVIFLVGFGLFKANGFAKTGTAYMAKVICSEIFVAGRTLDHIKGNDFKSIHPMLAKVSARVNESKKNVTTSLLGLGKAKAIYRENVGCTLNATDKTSLVSNLPTISPKPWESAKRASANALPRVDYDRLARSVEEAFEKDGLNHRAILVAVDGKLVFEHYADGFDQNSKLLSWSAAKSIVATLIGIGVHKNYLNIQDRLPVPEWDSDPARNSIRWDDLLRMQSGLDFDEDYADTNSDVNRMLFKSASMAALAAKSTALHKPATHFYYSSGSSNLLSRAIGDEVEAEGSSIIPFAYTNFLVPLGLTNTTLETDAAGDFVGSSYVYASGRDWLKMGQLYLQDGVWEGVRILPDNWNDYVATPTPSSDNQYGAHFWLNRDGDKAPENGEPRKRFFPDMPDNVYFFAGRDGQYVVIMPDKNMVLVRLGITREHPVIPKIAGLFTEIYQSVE